MPKRLTVELDGRTIILSLGVRLRDDADHGKLGIAGIEDHDARGGTVRRVKSTRSAAGFFMTAQERDVYLDGATFAEWWGGTDAPAMARALNQSQSAGHRRKSRKSSR